MLKSILKNVLKSAKPVFAKHQEIHHSAVANAWANKIKTCNHFRSYNDKIYPPQVDGEPPRHAVSFLSISLIPRNFNPEFFQYVCHVKENIKYSYKKMWYIACLIRGMTIDEALRQLNFINKKGAVAVKDTLLEAQDLALKEHNVEFKSNLWVSESFVGKGLVIKGLLSAMYFLVT